MNVKTKVDWNERMVFKLLAKRFPGPAFVVLPQVRNGVGFARRRDRTADALAISTWPSRGLSISGIEIKVSRSDWRRELAEPGKAAEIMQYCDYWLVAAPKGVIGKGEVPETWGCQRRDSIRQIKAAPRLEPKEIDMLLLCSILRCCESGMIARDEVKEEIQKQVEQTLAARRDQHEYEVKQLRETISTFEQASGLSLTRRWEAGDIGASVKFLREVGLNQAVGAVKRLQNEAKTVADRLGKALEEIK